MTASFANDPRVRSLGRTGAWGGISPDQDIVTGPGSLALASHPLGPLALGDAHDSLGGLTLPRGLAVDAECNVYWLRATRVFRLAGTEPPSFVPLPEVGGPGDEVRRFRLPTNLAVAGPLLAVAEYGNARVQVFDWRTLAVRAVWPFAPLEPAIDVAGHDSDFFILTRHKVFHSWPGCSALGEVRLAEQGPWDRIALDSCRRLYLRGRDEKGMLLAEFNATGGERLATYRDAREIRDRFDAPSLVAGTYRIGSAIRELLVVADELTRPHGKTRPAKPPTVDQVFAPPRMEPGGEQPYVFFDESGKHFELREPAATVGGPNWVSESETWHVGEPAYRAEGMWFSDALDSRVYHCQWDRLEVETGGDLPPGSQMCVRTFTSDTDLGLAVQLLPDDAWQEVALVLGGATPATDPRPAWMRRTTSDYFLGNPPGQYLWLRVDLRGDRFTTPVLRAIDVRFPRQSYLEYLPAVFSADQTGRDFLERLLGVFQAEWDVLEADVQTSWRFFDPRTVPDDAALIDYLASWLGVKLPAEWNTTKKRRLLAALPQLYAAQQRPDGKPGPCRRGSVEGLRDLLRVYLHNLTEQPPWRQAAYPVIIEGFRERRYLRFPPPASDTPDADRLAGSNERGRVILDETELGEGRLISPGTAACDPIDRHAHRFTVLVPAAWVRTSQDESLLRRTIEEEKPAHTEYELRLIPSRMRVGVHSRVGIDTILGSLEADPLPATAAGQLPAPFAPGGTLPASPGGPGMLLGVGRRVGVESSLT